jgi:hypothetical protein
MTAAFSLVVPVLTARGVRMGACPVAGVGQSPAGCLPGPARPSDVVRVSDSFSIVCSYLDGGPASSLGGTWSVQAAFESVGPGAEFRSLEITVPLDGRTGPASPYTANLAFPAGAVFPSGDPKLPAGDRNATYEVAVLLSYSDVAGNPEPFTAGANLERLTIYA